jgi:hypothetical protein
MANRKSIASLLLFVGSTLCFFLPFVTVSCGGVTAFTLTGQQLATGTTLVQPQPFGPPQTQKVSADPFALVAGFCAIAGIALSLIGRRLASPAAISGGAGALALLIMRSRLDDQLQKQGQGMAKATYETGFTLAVLLLIAGGAWNVYMFLQSRRIREAGRLIPDAGQTGSDHALVQSESPPSPLEGPSNLFAAHNSGGQPGARICRHCAQPIRAGVRFCETCGKSVEVTEGSPEAQIPLK